MRILITGSRNWTDHKRVLYAMEQAAKDVPLNEVVIVHGACPTGADAIANKIAIGSSVRVERYRADWAKYGKAAGPIRNQEMVDLGADLCLAFFLGESRGTKDCSDRAERAGIPVKKFFSEENQT